MFDVKIIFFCVVGELIVALPLLGCPSLQVAGKFLQIKGQQIQLAFPKKNHALDSNQQTAFSVVKIIKINIQLK